MVTLQNLHDLCNSLQISRKNEVKSIISLFLDTFIENHKPWRAFVGVKKRQSIPIHHYIKFPNAGCAFVHSYLYWPDLCEKEVKEVLEELGFVIIGPKLCLSVPLPEKGKPLTFAQEKVKEINHYYSLYIAQQRKEARIYYQEILNSLYVLPSEQISSCDGYTLFRNYKYAMPVSQKCQHYTHLLLTQNGFYPILDKNGNYLGLALSHTPSNN